MVQGVQNQTWNPEFDRGESKKYIYIHWYRKRLSKQSSNNSDIKTKLSINKISLKKFLYSKEHQYLIEEAAYRLGKIFTSYTSGKLTQYLEYKKK